MRLQKKKKSNWEATLHLRRRRMHRVIRMLSLVHMATRRHRPSASSTSRITRGPQHRRATCQQSILTHFALVRNLRSRQITAARLPGSQMNVTKSLQLLEGKPSSEACRRQRHCDGAGKRSGRKPAAATYRIAIEVAAALSGGPPFRLVCRSDRRYAGDAPTAHVSFVYKHGQPALYSAQGELGQLCSLVKGRRACKPYQCRYA